MAQISTTTSPVDSITPIEPHTKPKFTLPAHLIVKPQVDGSGAKPQRDAAQSKPVDDGEQLTEALWRTRHHVHFLGERDAHSGRFNNVAVRSDLQVVQMATRLAGERSDIYLAVSEYQTNAGRTQSNAVGAFAFWADIDCGEEKAAQGKGYATIDLASAAVDTFCVQTGLPKPNFIINSGAGLHVYWVMVDFVPKEQWQQFARKLKAVAAKVGFLADPSRTADIASVMRIPGTLNRKYDPPKPVTLLDFSKDFIANLVMFDALDRAYEKYSQGVLVTPRLLGLPRNSAMPRVAQTGLKDVGRKMAAMEILLTKIDANCGYQDWCNVLMAIHHESGGSALGLDLADRWSSTGSDYPGRGVIETKWRSFDGGSTTPITMGTIKKMVSDTGHDWMEVLAAAEPDFDPPCVEVEMVHPQVSTSPKPVQANQSIQPVQSAQPIRPVQPVNPLAKFSLQGHVTELEKLMVEQRPLLGDIVLNGQATTIFAKANTGKTLIILSLIIAAIKEGRIDPSKLTYINMDDNSSGLVEKVRLADEYGFHMVADGHQGFEAKEFRAAMEKMIETDSVNGTIVVLDTLKKFVNTMDKGKSSSFARVVRQFVLKGGTVIALAHANKNPGPDGKVVYSGTTDIVDDFDCAYTLAELPAQPDVTEKVVEFVNIKRRGNVALSAAYAYALERGISYSELLITVRQVDLEQLEPLKKAAALVADGVVIKAIEASIKSGINTKMKLAEAVAKAASISQRNALQMIEKYTGTDPEKHRWFFEVRERGAKVYVLLGDPIKPPDDPAVPGT